MIEEYINHLQEENREKLTAYDKEMQDLTQELSETEMHLHQLEKEKLDDKNIFSPRTQDSGTDLEIQKAQDQIRLLKQRLEYVSQMVETEVKNRDEYRKLAEEAAGSTADKETSGNAPAKEVTENHPAKIAAVKEVTENQPAEKAPAKEVTENQPAEKASAKEVVDDQELLDFLDSLCKKIQFSISLVNGNKNRCRSELKNVERMIRSYEEELKGSEHS